MVDYYELDGYPQEVHDRGTFKATRKLICDWEDRIELKTEIMAWPGQVYPYMDDWTVRACSCTTEPWGGISGSGPIASYEKAVLTVVYASPQYGDPQPYPAILDPEKHADITKCISESIEPTVVYRRLDYSLFTWDDGEPLKADEAPVSSFSRARYTLTRHYQSDVPIEAIDYVGCINSEELSSILMPSLTFPAHTLLLQPTSINLAVDENGVSRRDITYNFDYCEVGWRYFYRADVQDWARIKVASTGEYWDWPPERDFSIFWP